MVKYEVQMVVSYDGNDITENIIQGLEDAGVKVDFLSIADSSGEFLPEFMSVEA